MKLDKIFSSHMVFAHGKPIRIYGTGDKAVTVVFSEVEKSVVPENGKWLVEFEPMDCGGPYVLTAESDGEKTVLSDIYVGKVFLFAGQSNMQFYLKNVNFSQDSYDDERLRIFVTERLQKGELLTPDDGWKVCTEETAKNFSAIGYIASSEIIRRDGVHVGAVGCYQGASVIESWLPKGTYEKLGIEIPIDLKTVSHVCEEYSAWNGEATLYEFAFSQVIPFSFNAVVWYQGESDSTVAEAEIYADAVCALIDIWRNELRDGELPFVIVQIADFDGRRNEGWYGIQRAQEKIPDMRKNVRLVVSRDVCESDDIHPKNKSELSHRIAELL